MARHVHIHQAACTHLTVTRLYGPYVTCNLCKKTPKIGWVPSLSGKPLSEQPETNQLSPWIKEAIKNGHYTSEQVQMLIQQKQDVRNIISLAEERCLSTITGQRSSPHLQASTFSESTVLSTDVALSLSKVLSNENEAPERQTSFHAWDRVKQDYPIRQLPLEPICHARICHRCRMTFKDRAYTSLGDVLGPAPKFTAQHELDNRRLSDSNIVKGIGGRRLRRVVTTIADHRRMTNANNILGHEQQDHSMNRQTPNDEEDHFYDTYSTGDNYEHSFNDIENGNEIAGRENQSESDHEPTASRWKPFPRETADIAPPTGHHTYMGISASLPDIAEDPEVSEGGEVEVENGLAVTEEGVSSSAADIILQP
ncbi:hypothetical protein UCRPC4_g03825 [Phaeomoniella chlamydospora]|uniref:Uncharacterized protein n=1 Tax=Phaeomoniella chlamydospora TaxID=158046 RepID=A0A0G2EF98_PHACM|nr:hypothetical protein UCRPC4_g03825 [Phaeomoniella chlamydospora]